MATISRSHVRAKRMKVLVAIANYGAYRFGYLDRMIHTFQRMPFQTDIVIHSDRPKVVPRGVELFVGLPSEDPCSLPFAHKSLFAARVRDYDLFIYSEDDMLIEKQNLLWHLEASALLPEDEVPGFFRFERTQDGERWYPDAHMHYDWMQGSARRCGPHVFASFSNVHAACYALTRSQLERAIRSERFVVPPHERWYDMRVSAATDPYTQCGLTKRLCLTRWRDVLVHHMPNNYVGQLGTNQDTLESQIRTLVEEAPRDM
jgi:hypothetical protein